MLRVERHPEVFGELGAALARYEDELPGLGKEFIEEYRATLDQIREDPQRWRKIRGNTRKLNFHRFPYAIIYSIRPDAIYIKAVMHLHRLPGYWARRKEI